MTNKSKYLYIIDAGHGGLDAEGNYTTTDPRKKHIFEDGYTLYEGVTNRAIADKVYQKLLGLNIDFALSYHQSEDYSLTKRVNIANASFAKDKRTVFISIHSDNMPEESAGKGSGFSIWTSKGQTRSDKFAEVFAQVYQEKLPEFKFRKDLVDGDSDHEADFTVLKNTACPAILIENLFFDRRNEAEFLKSEVGQDRIANAIVEGILRCEKLGNL